MDINIRIITNRYATTRFALPKTSSESKLNAKDKTRVIKSAYNGHRFFFLVFLCFSSSFFCCFGEICFSSELFFKFYLKKIKQVVVNQVNLTAQVQQDFPARYFPSPQKQFPFKSCIASLPHAKLNRHLVRTIIPKLPERQPRRFP